VGKKPSKKILKALKTVTEFLEKEGVELSRKGEAAKSLRINNLPIEQYLNDKALAASRNIVKSTYWEQEDRSRVIPCIFLAGAFDNTGCEFGQVPDELLKEWARMLNDLAENHSWLASLHPCGAVQMAASQTHPMVVSLFSFIFLDNPPLWNTENFNKYFGTDLSVPEGAIAPLKTEPFKWLAALPEVAPDSIFGRWNDQDTYSYIRGADVERVGFMRQTESIRDKGFIQVPATPDFAPAEEEADEALE
jgi:hypothetical protein